MTRDKGPDDSSKAVLIGLDFARRRDDEKGGPGIRSTRDVAETAQLTLSAVRRDLRKLARDGLVDEYGISGGAGWRITAAGRAALAKSSQDREDANGPV